MLFLRLPGYFSRASSSTLYRAAATLQPSIEVGNGTAAAAHYGIAQQLTRLNDLTASVHTATNSAFGAFNTHDTATRVVVNTRGFAALPATDAAPAEIFDRELKRVHRDRAARVQSPEDPLLEAVAGGLVDRLADCKREFPVAAVINGAGENVVRRLSDGRSGIGEVLLLDTSWEMLRRVQRLEIRYLQADEEALPLRLQSVDVIICPLGLHWINDLPGALTQCRRALKPDGLFLGALLGGESLQELRIACALAEQEVEGGVSPRISPLAQVRDAGNLLTRAGLSIPAVDVDEVVIRYSDPSRLVVHLRAMGEQNAVRKARRSIRRETALLTAQKYREMFGEPDDTVPATFQVIYLTGWAPHSSQQRAARRGTATASFEDLHEEIGKAEGTE